MLAEKNTKKNLFKFSVLLQKWLDATMVKRQGSGTVS